MIQNNYFIKNIVDVTQDILDVCEESVITRKNNAKTKCVLKLPITSGIPSVVSSETFLDHDAIMVELAKPEWIPTEI